MKKSVLAAALAAAIPWPSAALADEAGVARLRAELDALRADYETRIRALETRLARQEQELQAQQVETRELREREPAPVAAAPAGNAFNPQISLILDGRMASFARDPQDYRLPGFALGGEAGLFEEGMSIGHTELSVSANIDHLFFGQFTVAMAEHEGETETEVEEAFFETLGLGEGFTVRGGRFFSAVGYLNQQHEHAWDFADAPLVYAGLWGNKYLDDGVRLSWVAPTRLLVELGAEAFAGAKFPAGGERDSGVGARVLFANFGGDWGASHSWQSGLSHYAADVEARAAGGHEHGAEGGAETPTFSGDSDAWGAHLVYKWAPQGNYRQRNFKLQAEYFAVEEDGDLVLAGSDPLEFSSLDGDQQGFYLQGVYQFRPQWRLGMRYDRLWSDNEGSDPEVLEEAGLLAGDGDPERWSAMFEWLPSEFSRLRLQYNRDDSLRDGDDQWFLQYTHSLGAHGAHRF